MHKKKKVILAVGFLVLGIGLIAAGDLRADGFIVPHPPRPGDAVPPLTVKYHHVTIEIANQVAKTSVDQVFLNNFDRDIEGTYIFPLPEGASISEFAMWIGSQKVSGEILDAQQARRVYEDIVRRMKDPALLEYIGRNMFMARVFPIPAKGEKRIQISYTEVLRSEKNLVRYRYPLSTEQLSYEPIKDVSLSVKISSPVPISSVYSPTHKISVRKETEGRAVAGFEESNTKPDKDFVLYYSLSPDDVGLSLINWSGAEGDYFMLLAAPRFAAAKEKVLNKNLIFVLDSSGSMSGTKIQQTKEAARFVINHLEENDRFAIIDFDDGVSLFAPELLPAQSANRAKALKFIDEIQDSGGTNINEALLQALKMVRSGDRPNYILFLTDGQPTVGATDTGAILRNIGGANEARARIFVFGVGNDVNTELLDQISLMNRGTSVYVGPNENLEVSLSNYYEKISAPLLSDLVLSTSGIEFRDAYPRTLPDLFKGSQLVLVGRYSGAGPATVTLRGKVGKEDRKFVLEGQRLVKDDAYNFLPRLWATRRIGFLLEEIRLRGTSTELVDEVKNLGLKYGIVTPYTSYLVTEKERLSIAAATPEAQDALQNRQVSGAGAVKMAAATQALKSEDQAAQAASKLIRYKEDKTFFFKDGFWVDSTFKEGGQTKEIKFHSDEYFRLVADKPGLAKYLAVGAKVIVCTEGVNYKIIE
ncbi:MAG: VIT domain-containing protein [Candidatus Aminicenantes bacterium]|nr:VIT domain-containing protein [Candidatus Aminicenantes bacterium]